MVVTLNRYNWANLTTRYEEHTYYVCIIIKLMYFVCVDHNSMDPNPNRATARRDSLAKNLGTLHKSDKTIFSWWRISKITKPPIFSLLRGALRSGGVKIWGVLLFLNIMKIRNNDFITILVSENLNVMVFPTNYWSNPTVNVPGWSITHIGSPWTLNITPVLFTVSGDLILSSKNRFITILVSFISESHREVAHLGLESIELGPIRTKYIDFLIIHTQHMYPSYPTIRWPLLSLLSGNPSNMTVRQF